MVSISKDVFLSSYSNLNTSQKEAVDTIDGAVLVVAGPGTGKTQLLSMRVANILLNTDTNPQNILCLTFTESAAINMRKRLRSIIGIEAEKVAINTFHGLGNEIINANPDCFYKGAQFAAADDLAKVEIIQQILEALPPNDQLKSFHPSIGWIYADDLLKRIGDLKKAGLTPLEYHEIINSNEIYIESLNKLFQKLFARQMKDIKLVDVESFYNEVLECVDTINAKTRVLSTQENDLIEVNGQKTIFNNWGFEFVKSLAQAIEESQATGKYKSNAITIWKERWGKKDENNALQLKDCVHLKKHQSTARVYQEYQSLMYANNLFDFDDMLLDVVEELRTRAELRYEYQERYQYVLVDEFQDTNGSQMSLINLLLNTEITNNKPNILVVGDDEQSIYKFQGANIQNILFFKNLYDDVKIITLNDNYRSTQDILDFASRVIEASQERLADYSGISKELRAMR